MHIIYAIMNILKEKGACEYGYNECNDPYG